jgi:hypothetical protein
MDVTIYDAVNFGGRSATLGVGAYPLSGPTAPIDKVSSIQVPAGLVALVYELADTAGGYGRSADLMENYTDVSTLGLAGIAFIQVFLAERAPVLADVAVKTLGGAQGAPLLREVWIRGAVVNEQYVAGHWAIGNAPSASGPAVVSPGPLPHLLNITTIQGQPMANPPHNVSSPNWSSQVVGGTTFDGSDSHPFEWVSVLNPTLEQDDEVGVAGFAAAVELSQHDLPFTHPFGGDFEFAIVPDAAYTNLLAPSNLPPANSNTDSEVSEAFTQVRGLGLPPVGAFAMEVEAGIVPETYRAVLGDRVAVYGRWIVDAGHNDFHTEIHPPLLLARAQVVNAQGAAVYPDANAITFMQLWGRPYQAAQKFTDGSSKNLPLQTYITNISETLGDIVAYPPIFPKPFDGVHLVTFVVRPPQQEPPTGGSVILGPAYLECSYSFTTNKSCGVQVQKCLSDPNAVSVILALNSAGYPTLPDPPSKKVAYTIDSLKDNIPADLGTLTSFLVDVVEKYQGIVHGGNLYVRTYNPLPAPDVTTHAVPFTALSALPQSQVNVDDTQPFPIVGWLKLRWVRSSSIVVGGGLQTTEQAKV